MKYTSSSSGTWEILQVEDLRGSIPNTSAGGGSGGGGSINVKESIELDGDLFYHFVGDVDTPSEGQYYGYSSGAKGWFTPAGTGSTGTVTGATNIGGAEEVFDENINGNLQFRTLSGGTNMTVTQTGDVVLFESSGGSGGGGTVTGGTNIGGAAEVYEALSGGSLQFRTLSGSSSVSVVQSGDTINFAAGEGAFTNNTDKFFAGKSANQTIGTSWADITSWDVETVTGDSYSWNETTGELTFMSDGWYDLTYYITTTSTSGSARTGSAAKMLIDTGGGYADILDSEIRFYNRLNTAYQGSTNGSASFWVEAVSGVTKIKTQIIKGGSDTVVVDGGTVGLKIVKSVLGNYVDNSDNSQVITNNDNRSYNYDYYVFTGETGTTIQTTFSTIIPETGSTREIIDDDVASIIEIDSTGSTTVVFNSGLTHGFNVLVANPSGGTVTFSGGTATLASKEDLVSMSAQHGIVTAYYNSTKNVATIFGDLE